MIRYLVLKEPGPDSVEDLRIETVDVERETEGRYEGGIGSHRTYFAYSKYYWIAFDTREEAETYRRPFVNKYWSKLFTENSQRHAELKATLEK